MQAAEKHSINDRHGRRATAADIFATGEKGPTSKYSVFRPKVKTCFPRKCTNRSAPFLHYYFQLQVHLLKKAEPRLDHRCVVSVSRLCACMLHKGHDPVSHGLGGIAYLCDLCLQAFPDIFQNLFLNNESLNCPHKPVGVFHFYQYGVT